MKIALDNRAIHFSGIGVYTHNLYQGLNKWLCHNKWLIFDEK